MDRMDVAGQVNAEVSSSPACQLAPGSASGRVRATGNTVNQSLGEMFNSSELLHMHLQGSCSEEQLS